MKQSDDRGEHADLALDMELMDYADGTLAPEKRAELEARIARDPEAREAVALWRHHDNLIHQAARSADTLPSNLKLEKLERELARKLAQRRVRAALFGPGVRRVVASVVLFAAGWGAHSFVAAPVDGGPAHPYFVGPTLAGHSYYLFGAAQRSDFTGDEIEVALDWMSEQMQRKIESPKLEMLGYRVEGSRVSLIDGQPVAIFYYRTPQDELVTVSMSPHGQSQPGYALQESEIDGSRMAYWTSDDLHYVIMTNDAEASLTSLAAAVRP